MTTQEANKTLEGTFSNDKNETLFSRFGINYNNEPEIYKKGSVLSRKVFRTMSGSLPCRLTDHSTSSRVVRHLLRQQMQPHKPLPKLLRKRKRRRSGKQRLRLSMSTLSKMISGFSGPGYCPGRQVICLKVRQMASVLILRSKIRATTTEHVNHSIFAF